MKRNAALLCTLPLVLAGCVRISVRTDVGPGGEIRRHIRVDTDAPHVATRLQERFGPTWTVTRGRDGKSFEAARNGQPADAPNPTAVAVAVSRGIFWSDLRFDEDLRPAPRALRPGGAPLLRPFLADDTSLELLYKMASQQIEVKVELHLPGRPVEGNWQERGPGGTLVWNGSLRALPAIHARTRVLHPIPIALAAGSLGLVAAGTVRVLVRTRRTR